MNNSARQRLLRVVLPVWIVLAVVQIECPLTGNDVRSQEGVQTGQSIYQEWLVGLNAAPSKLLPPRINAPEAPVAAGGTISFSGYAANQADLGSAEAPVVALYSVLPQGCGAPMKRGKEIQTVVVGAPEGSTSESAKHDWSMPDVPIPADVAFVAFTLRADGQESGLSEVKVVNLKLAMPVVETPLENAQVGLTMPSKGTGMAKLCLELRLNEKYVDEHLITDLGKWGFERLKTYPGLNTISIKVKGVPSLPAVIRQVTQEAPLLQWPFGVYANETYTTDLGASCVNVWGGTNDWYLAQYRADLKKEAVDRLVKDPNHRGIDLNCNAAGADIYVRAVADGEVYMIDEQNNDGAGVNVAIDHGSWVSWYLHLSGVTKDNGEKLTKGEIKAGQVIGLMGKTGAATGYHLHLQAFWWGDTAAKEAHKKKYPDFMVRQAGMTIINLNNPDLATCPGIAGAWGMSWQDVSIPQSSSTTFHTCTQEKICKCPED